MGSGRLRTVEAGRARQIFTSMGRWLELSGANNNAVARL